MRCPLHDGRVTQHKTVGDVDRIVAGGFLLYRQIADLYGAVGMSAQVTAQVDSLTGIVVERRAKGGVLGGFAQHGSVVGGDGIDGLVTLSVGTHLEGQRVAVGEGIVGCEAPVAHLLNKYGGSNAVGVRSQIYFLGGDCCCRAFGGIGIVYSSLQIIGSAGALYLPILVG